MNKYSMLGVLIISVALAWVYPPGLILTLSSAVIHTCAVLYGIIAIGILAAHADITSAYSKGLKSNIEQKHKLTWLRCITISDTLLLIIGYAAASIGFFLSGYCFLFVGTSSLLLKLKFKLAD